MKVTFTLDLEGARQFEDLAFAIQKNIDALERAANGKQLSRDFVLMNDTKSILEGIRRELRAKAGRKEHGSR